MAEVEEMCLEDALIKNLDFEHCLEEERLKSFKNWSFKSGCACTAEKMAEAGFYHCPTDDEPDLVRCYVCFKELDGWEANDDPWKEHESHSSNCLFVKIHQKEAELTIENFLKLECERHINKLKKLAELRIKEFREQGEKAKEKLKEILLEQCLA
ncbi:baculoviral IAP repeat-containing protein 5-like [Centruroides sculpturatus]|uniref:baculoviral IAP repeat-containing protein 5-like n=1 Tax=Centruroides sculpturatus TaxID=218467 RepID=UPI000C6DA81E|nr:baculoviral IAP repeat-containing protein 5-like [Centruroides sculpturatus]